MARASRPARSSAAPVRKGEELARNGEELFAAEMAQVARARAARARWWAHPDPAAWRRGRARLRATMRRIFGPFPESDCALAPLVTGTLRRPGYAIDLVRYRSRPGISVTANLYIPDGARAAPGVLLACGHDDLSKAFPAYQALAIDLARRGLVVLAFDPIGQAERGQCRDAVRRRASGVPVYEHIALDRAMAPGGGWIGTWMVHDAMRSLDYLASRPEVDPARLAMTGHSGGGTQTLWTAAVDDRLRAAVPLCALTTLEARLRSREPADAEQNPPGFLAQGLELEDALAMLWPHPVAVGAARGDFFPIAGTRASVARLRRLYAAGGDARGARLLEVPGGHDLSPDLRRQVADWLAARFALPRVRAPRPAVPEASATLRVTRTGNVLDEPGETWAFAAIAAARPRPRAADPRRLRAVLGLPATPRRPACARLGAARGAARRAQPIESWTVTSEAGIGVPAAFLPAPAPAAATLVLWACDGDLATDRAADGPLARLRGAGHAVLACEARDIGSTRGASENWWARYARGALVGDQALPRGVQPWRDPVYDGLYGTAFEHAMTGVMLDRPMLGQRVHDLLAVLAAARAAGHARRRRVVLVGGGPMALAALYAAALARPAVAGVALIAPLASYALLASEPFGVWAHDSLARGILAAGDVPQALALVPRALLIDPLDARGAPLPTREARRLFAAHRGARLRFRRDGHDPHTELLAWLQWPHAARRRLAR